MRRSLSIFTGLLLGALLSLAGATQASAQEKKKEKQGRIEGVIQMINKDTSTITVRKGNVPRQIVYSADTKVGRFTARGKPDAPASASDLKEGQRIIALGKFNKTQFAATQISIRLGP